jgi:serine/tyrosine/threonine adenylyltransferase
MRSTESLRQNMQTSIKKLNFTNKLTTSLVADPITTQRPRQVYNAHFSFVNPEPCPSPRLVSIVSSVAKLIGLDIEKQSAEERQGMVEVLSGNQPANPNSKPWALCYGGHQFGSWAGQLGDGRAISLGQVQTASGLMELQLKGAGLTPYSRFADGYLNFT